MCGIVGIYRPGSIINENDIRTMLDKIAYRGPDDNGLICEQDIGFGHVRLSIQDLSSLAAQPMISNNQRYIITYNGEIYNVKELRDNLQKHNIEIKSTGDTRLLLEYISFYGIEETLDTVEGMFAFGLWDRKEKTLILARDRHGIKPLVYNFGPNGEVRFASEMKALISSQPEPDLITLNATLLGLGGTWGDHTVFRGIRHVCAGEWLLFGENSNMKRTTFFHINDFVNKDLSDQLNTLSKNSVVGRVETEFEESVKLRLISDAPVAVFASGGIDSSIVAAIAKKYYPDLKLYHANVLHESEFSTADYLAKVLNLEIKSVAISDDDILESTPAATYYYELPLSYHNGSCVPFYLVSKLAGQDGIKVVLTGEGSDEYFIGYPIYAIYHYLKYLNKFCSFSQKALHLIPALGNLLWPYKEHNFSHQLRRLMFRYELQERRGEAANVLNFITNKTELDRRIMTIDMVLGNVRTLLHRNDRLAMAWGLESRFPFLGHRLAETAVNLPSKYKIRKVFRFNDWRHAFISDKWIIRKIAEKYLPHSLAHRQKFGLQSSVYQRLKIDKEYLYNGFMSEFYGLNNKAIDNLFEKSHPNWLSQILLLELWGRIFPMGYNLEKVREDFRQHVAVNL